MVKHTQTIRRQQTKNCLSVFDYIVWLALKGLTKFRPMFFFYTPLKCEKTIWSVFRYYSEWMLIWNGLIINYNEIFTAMVQV